MAAPASSYGRVGAHPRRGPKCTVSYRVRLRARHCQFSTDLRSITAEPHRSFVRTCGNWPTRSGRQPCSSRVPIPVSCPTSSPVAHPGTFTVRNVGNLIPAGRQDASVEAAGDLWYVARSRTRGPQRECPRQPRYVRSFARGVPCQYTFHQALPPGLKTRSPCCCGRQRSPYLRARAGPAEAFAPAHRQVVSRRPSCVAS